MNTRKVLTALAALLALAPVQTSAAQAPPASDPRQVSQIIDQVQEAELRASINTLVGFGTRHTRSDATHPTRGIGAARNWTEARFKSFSAACGGCLTIVRPGEVVSGTARIPNPTLVENVIAIQRGTTDPTRVIVISGHIDSINSDQMDFTGDAPGANDDGSGTSVVIEAARVLSKYKFPATLVFAVLSGEEQGLNGGKVLADYAKAQGWKVEANINNDIVGNTRGSNGITDNTHFRVFSEGVRAADTPQNVAARNSTGGEVDSPSRNLARFIDRIADDYLLNFDVKMIYRTDRYGRGGDQTQMLRAGFPAVRMTEAVENFDRQHQTVRNVNGRQYGDLADGVDFPYLAKVAQLNIASMAALALAPAPPLEVRIQGGVSPDTRINWTAVPGAAGYRVWWRDTTAPQWQNSRWVAGGQTTATLPNVSIDDYFFGVSAVAADGQASPVQFPGQVGAFVITPPAPPAARPTSQTPPR